MIDTVGTDQILNISPYNALGYGLAVLVMIWVIIYFKNQLYEKEKIINELNAKNHRAWDIVNEKLTEISMQNRVDKPEIIHHLQEIKTRLEK